MLMISAAQAQTQTSTDNKTESSIASFPSGEQVNSARLSYNIIEAFNTTWCYDILKDGKLIIHQPSKPGLPGNEGFKTKEQAAKVAELVIEKLVNGEMPPTITKADLQKLDIQ